MAESERASNSLVREISPRYLSLDVLRGMTIALMIVVTSSGSRKTVFAPLVHAGWHGFTLADLVFPAFLFMVGNAMSFSMEKFMIQGQSIFLGKVLKRTVIIFILGLMLHSFPFIVRSAGGAFEIFNFSSIRIMGVLGRIAICYCIASLLIYYFKGRGALAFSVFVLFGYWAVLYLFGDPPDPYGLKENAVLKLDLLVFRPENLYHSFGVPFDPEGLLSTFPAVVTVISGYFAGLFIRKNGSNKSTILVLLGTGVACVIIALLWDVYFPINKKLWTSSFVLYTSGWCLVALAFLMYIIEVSGFRKWSYFFEVFGKNPLFIFILAGLIRRLLSLIRLDDESLKDIVYKNLFLTWSQGYSASLMYAVFFTLVMWLIAYWMDRRKIYVRV